ncbi:recombinase family protein [Paenibacillus sp. YYML68]|uniref:recombinase family protein n=1 Tax=Paenibacillus sp. YYML68 TaxID=2909250 RepID=UPI002490189D|nr:recombinase family protein [Paenibacillus sp. YYML68]
MYKALDKNAQYAVYMRKSRVDLEAESNGEEDTYTKHERILFDLAAKLGIQIREIYKEKAGTSGERISERPEMLRLLTDVEAEKWDGILAVEVERLARGDTMDQGIVAQTFKYSNTLIITPMRTYDPNDPNDEEYFEFNLFMSRREFKTTTRRMQTGRVMSVNQGKYVGNQAPYGYNRVKLPGKGFTLEPHPEQAPIVQLIFAIYTDPDPDKWMGTAKLARYLNEELKVPTARQTRWTVATINGILRNTVYIGKVRWGSRPLVKKKDSKSRPRKPRDQWIEAQGIHPPLIDEVTFARAQEVMKSNSHAPVSRNKIANPLAGLVRCGMCGGPMLQRPYNSKIPDSLICPETSCSNVSSYVHLVEQRLLIALQDWLQGLRNELNDRQEDPSTDTQAEAKIKALEKVRKELKKQLEEVNEQLAQVHDLLEKKIYTLEVFMERSTRHTERLKSIKSSLEETEKELEEERHRTSAKFDTIPKVERVLDDYPLAGSPGEKNALLKEVVRLVKYRKETGGRWSGAADQFELEVFPRI